MVGKRLGNVDHQVRKRIRQRRNALGMSQETLADALGISYQQIQKYEVGADRVMASRLWDIAEALEVDVAYFFESIVKRPSRARKPSTRRSVGAKTAGRKGRSARR